MGRRGSLTTWTSINQIDRAKAESTSEYSEQGCSGPFPTKMEGRRFIGGYIVPEESKSYTPVSDRHLLIFKIFLARPTWLLYWRASESPKIFSLPTPGDAIIQLIPFTLNKQKVSGSYSSPRRCLTYHSSSAYLIRLIYDEASEYIRRAGLTSYIYPRHLRFFTSTMYVIIPVWPKFLNKTEKFVLASEKIYLWPAQAFLGKLWFKRYIIFNLMFLIPFICCEFFQILSRICDVILWL